MCFDSAILNSATWPPRHWAANRVPPCREHGLVIVKLLLVEDDELLRNLLVRELRRDGNVVAVAATRAEASRHLMDDQFEVLVVDWNLPDGTGIDVVTSYRASTRSGGAIVITVRPSIDDRVAALEAGADDILVKPFELRELRARIRAVGRRPQPWHREAYTVGNLTVDCEGLCASVRNRAMNLTPKEWLVLRFLARNPGRVIPRSELASQVWDSSHEPDAHVLDVHVGNLRAKLQALGSDVGIVTRRGAGYQLIADGGRGRR